MLSNFTKRTLQPTYQIFRTHTTKNKIYQSAEEAVDCIKDGSFILSGGFGVCGIPENLIDGILNKGQKNLTFVSNNCGLEGYGLGKLLHNKQIKRFIGSYVGENKEFESQYLTGELELELLPQGTMAEKARAAGAGIPAFYTPAGFGTMVQNGGFPIKLQSDGKTPDIVAEPKEVRIFDNQPFIMEKAFKADYAIIKAWKADTRGNLMFRGSARNFNPDFAQAAKCTIVEAEEIVEAGEISPDSWHLPGIYVDRLVQGKKYQKKIEKLVLSTDEGITINGKLTKGAQAKRLKIAKRAAEEIKDGTYVNLGIGIPTLIPDMVAPGADVEWQSEIGVLGVGSYPKPGEEDPDIINAGKETITTKPGTTFFQSSQSFAIMRGHHLNVTVIGGMQVSRQGDLANWIIPGEKVKGMGGAMDLVTSGSKVIVIMEHLTKKGGHKILDQCSLPLTGYRVVNQLITDMAVFDFKHNDIYLTDIAKEFTLEDVRAATGCDFHLADNVRSF